MIKLLPFLLIGIWEELPPSSYSYDNSTTYSTNVHESTHFVNAQTIATKEFRLWCGEYYTFRSPKFTKREVISFIPVELKGPLFDNYFIQKRYEAYPLYILDEFSAYINGCEAALEKNDNSNSTVASNIYEMKVYSICVFEAMKKLEPECYNTNLPEFKRLLKKADVIFAKGIDKWPHRNYNSLKERVLEIQFNRIISNYGM